MRDRRDILNSTIGAGPNRTEQIVCDPGRGVLAHAVVRQSVLTRCATAPANERPVPPASVRADRERCHMAKNAPLLRILCVGCTFMRHAERANSGAQLDQLRD
jgi:hypothetical protein